MSIDETSTDDSKAGETMCEKRIDVANLVNDLLLNQRNWYSKYVSSHKDAERPQIYNFEDLVDVVKDTVRHAAILSDHDIDSTDMSLSDLLILINITFYMRLYDHALSFLLTEEGVWENKEKDLAISLLFKKNLDSMTVSYHLIKTGYSFQGVQILRNHMESSCTLYLCLVDSDFMDRYLFQGERKEEIKNWGDHLKHYEMSKRAHRIHQKWNSMNDGYIIGAFREPPLFLSTHFREFYDHSSQYVHNKVRALLEDSWNEGKEGYHVGLYTEADRSQWLEVMGDVFVETAHSISSALRSKLPDMWSHHTTLGELSYISVALWPESKKDSSSV